MTQDNPNQWPPTGGADPNFEFARDDYAYPEPAPAPARREEMWETRLLKKIWLWGLIVGSLLFIGIVLVSLLVGAISTAVGGA
ncbi:membrane protein [Rhodococcus phage Reynauld]|uniref:Membrane protein n=1 Tax=Rhodococcus phage Reynauld TaxID=3062845 RepID=A0ACD4UH82_9CAUD|nr:membrane protein [Rhodococcus phage Reynauld]